MAVTNEQVVSFLNTRRGVYLMGKALYMATNKILEGEDLSDELVSEVQEMNIVMGTLFPLYLEVTDPKRHEGLMQALAPKEEGSEEDAGDEAEEVSEEEEEEEEEAVDDEEETEGEE